MFNVTFFIILKAYAGMATHDEASCWAKCSSVHFFPFVFYLNSPNKRILQIVSDLCQGFAGYTEASSSNDAGLRHTCICKAPQCFMPLFFFSCKVSTRKRKIVWKPFASQGHHTEKPHRAELCKNVWCCFHSWAYATFCSSETICAVGFFFPPQSWSSGHGEEGLVRDSSCPVVCKHYDMYDLDKNTQGQQNTYKQAALMTDFTWCYCAYTTGLCLI